MCDSWLTGGFLFTAGSLAFVASIAILCSLLVGLFGLYLGWRNRA